MAILMMKAPVGAAAKNNPNDVTALRRMLFANGYNLPEDGKFDAKMGAVIKQAQKKCGVACDGVIKPGDKVSKSLVTKYMLAEKAAANVKMCSFKYRGKTYEYLEKDHKKFVETFFRSVNTPTRKLITQVDMTMEHYKFYLDVATQKEGLAMALTQASIMFIGRIEFPSDRKMLKALDARHALERSLKSKDLKGFCAAMRTAEADINSFVIEFRAYVQKMEGKGKAIQGAVGVVKTSAFTAAEILAVPVVMTYTRLPPDKAYLASKTAFAAVESLAEDLGRNIAGQKVTVSGSLGRASYAAAKEFVLGWCGGKIKFEGKLLTRMMKVIGPVVGKALPFLPKDVAARFVSRYIQGFSEATLKGILDGLVKAVEIWFKKGSPPSKSEVEKLFDDLVQKAVLGGLTKNLGKFNSNWAAKHQLVLQHKMVPMAFKRVDAKNRLTDAQRKVVIKRVMGALQKTALNTGYDAVFDKATGHESGNAMVLMAEAALQNDRKITAEIDAIIMAELKALENAR